ncbi:hypothetical protein RIF29_22146 [Crotalaria pallida]|uniref:UspA domain-containing protein n=1 Tax=Crotalaria pallida TaxID=3830 RepID=A0AAN9F6M4_CROPI
MDEIAENERRILVAIDEGDESMYALSWCLKNLAFQNSKDTLILLYVKPPRAAYGDIWRLSSDITAGLDKYNQQVETKVEEGDPRDVICEMAEKLGADILVMGSHGYGIVKRAFLGSVSNHCAQNVKFPVLLVNKKK